MYNERTGISGLHYVALGVGLTGASQLNAATMDRVYRYFSQKNGGQGKSEYRLRKYTHVTRREVSYWQFRYLIASMIPGTVLQPIGLLITGWSAQSKTHWILTDIVGFSCELGFVDISSELTY